MLRNYEENKDYGFYSRNNSNCSECQHNCSLDQQCGAVRCDGTKDPEPSPSHFSPGCLWWRKGACLDDYWIYSKLDYKYGYTCYKGWKL